jgi:hypothetical protein
MMVLISGRFTGAAVSRTRLAAKAARHAYV